MPDLFGFDMNPEKVFQQWVDIFPAKTIIGGVKVKGKERSLVLPFTLIVRVESELEDFFKLFNIALIEPEETAHVDQTIISAFLGFNCLLS